MPKKSDYHRLREKLLKYLHRPRYSPLNRKQLAKALKLAPKETSLLKESLAALEQEGRVARIRKDHWILPDEAQLVTGVIVFNPKGHAVLIPNEESEEKLHIAAEDTWLALHQDLVVVRKQPIRPASSTRHLLHDKPSGRVIRILKRRRENYVGTLQRSGRFFHVVPDDPRYIQNFYVPSPNECSLDPAPEIGDKVVVRLTNWETRHINPEGEIIERLGRPGDPGVDILGIIRKHNLATEFPADALSEVGDFAHPEGDAPQPENDPRRLDLRDEFIITIDPETAKDFDDAIHVTPLKDDLWEVGVHIADVSSYVQVGSALDREARKRGNSTYLVNQVIPMLPEELSNGLCSLNPHVDRLTFSVIARIDSRGRVMSHRITTSLIHSKHRLTYEQAMERLERKPQDAIDHLIHRAWHVADRLRQKRFAEGAIDLEMPEVKVMLNAHGEPIEIVRQNHDKSHQLIEEFMLMANEVVALELRNRHKPAVFRVHEAPDPEKLQEYRENLAIHGIKVGDLTRMQEVRKALAEVAGRPDGHALKVGFLRSLKKADYRPKPLGHYGLAKANYTHFTSPIRRYADLIVHRALKSCRRVMSPDQLFKTALHISETERISSDAEIESVKLKKLEYFERQMNADPPAQFTALIMDVTNFGLFVELPDSLMSGLIHISSMEGDFFTFEETDQRLRGKRTGVTYQLGDLVNVEVERVDIFKQQIDFRMVLDPDQKTPARHASKPARSRKKMQRAKKRGNVSSGSGIIARAGKKRSGRKK
ncbi:MAG: ribonuclease R [Verrucomicrobiota bacterium]